jgi:apolipoprotein D and lipocalin family protein
MLAKRLLGLLLSTFVVGCATKPQPLLRTAAAVDLNRYAGRWFEIARLPSFFQRDDSRATADYAVQADGTVRVVNTEHRPDGTTRIAIGAATAVAESGGSRLRVKFTGLAALAPVPHEGNYWIIALAPDYSVALVGTPDRRFLWLLARRSNLSPAIRQRYLDFAKREGFASEKALLAHWPER